MRSLPRIPLILVALLSACTNPPVKPNGGGAVETGRRHFLERVDDTGVIQLYADGFENLKLRDKILCYHLANAALAGRDIFIDQKFAHGLAIRDLLEELYAHRQNMTPASKVEIERYTKLFWLNNGIHDHLSTLKRRLNISLPDYQAALRAARKDGARLPSAHEVSELYSVMTDPNTFRSCTNKSPANEADPLEASCNNLYFNISSVDLERFEEKNALNSRLVKKGGNVTEEIYRAGDPESRIPPGRYARQLQQVNKHLALAAAIAPEKTRVALELLIKYYKTGEFADWHAYNVAWVKDTDSVVDTINGFVEVYLDARGAKGAWEAVVSFVNPAKAAAMKDLAKEAQWFEDRMPWDKKFKKKSVRGITANAITVIMETGDSGPMTPIGINLPNEADIRRDHGSKSVNLANVVEGYGLAASGGSSGAFSWSPEEAARAKKYGAAMNDVHTNLHEVVGHASGQILIPSTAILGTYYSTLEEGRADLVGLYWISDKKLQVMGIVPNDSAALAKCEAYARNALVQLRRVPEGGKIEEDHMRNRQMIVHWLIANTESVKVEVRDGKTFYRVTSAQSFREGCGRLLAEVMRIKGEGDFKAGKALVDTYGTKVDAKLHQEVLKRMKVLDIPSSSGFVQPELTAVSNSNGEIIDVKVSYPSSLEDQMLRFSGKRK